MKELIEIQQVNIKSTLTTYLATIPIANAQNIDCLVDVLTNVLAGVKNDPNLQKVPDTMRKTVINFVEYAHCLFKLLEFHPDVCERLTSFSKGIIQEKIQFLSSIRNSAKEIRAYSQAQPKLGAKNPLPIPKALADYYPLEESERAIPPKGIIARYGDLLSATWTGDRQLDTKRIEDALKNQFVIQLFQERHDAFLYDMCLIESKWNYDQIINCAVFMARDKRIGKLYDDGLWTFEDFKKNGRDQFSRYINLLLTPVLWALLDKKNSSLRETIASLDINQPSEIGQLAELITKISPPSIFQWVLAGKIKIEDIWSFRSDSKTVWSEDQIVEVAETLSHPSVKPFVNKGHINGKHVFRWGSEEVLRVVEKYLVQAEISELLDKGWLKINAFSEPQRVEDCARLLLRFKADFQSLIDRNAIAVSDLEYFARGSEENVQEIIHILQQNPKHGRLKIVDFNLASYMSAELFEKFRESIEDLNQVPSSVDQFLSQYRKQNDLNHNFYSLMHHGDRINRRTFLDAVWYPEVRETMLSGLYGFPWIIQTFGDPDSKRYFLTALSDPVLRQKQYDQGSIYYKDILDIGRSMVAHLVFPLVQFGYLTIDEIVSYQCWEPEALVTLAKYKLLLDLQRKANDSALKVDRLVGKAFPEEIKEVQKILRGLDEISEIKNALTYAFKDDKKMLQAASLIDETFNTVFLVLQRRQNVSRGLFNKISPGKTFCKNEYEKLCHFNEISVLSTPYQVGRWYLRQGEERAYDYFIKVVETDPNYYDALWHAGRLAYIRCDYDDAHYLLAKALKCAQKKNDTQAENDVQRALAVIHAKLQETTVPTKEASIKPPEGMKEESSLAGITTSNEDPHNSKDAQYLVTQSFGSSQDDEVEGASTELKGLSFG